MPLCTQRQILLGQLSDWSELELSTADRVIPLSALCKFYRADLSSWSSQSFFCFLVIRDSPCIFEELTVFLIIILVGTNFGQNIE